MTAAIDALRILNANEKTMEVLQVWSYRHEY
jgi:hypothetical protein